VNGRRDLRERAVNVMAFLFGVLVRPVIVEVVLEDLAMLVIGMDSWWLLIVSAICTVPARALLGRDLVLRGGCPRLRRLAARPVEQVLLTDGLHQLVRRELLGLRARSGLGSLP